VTRALLAAVALATVLASAGDAADPGTIVFAADRAPLVNGEVYRLDAGGRQADLSKSPFVDQDPSAAPHGGSVAFLSNRGGDVALYTVRLDGTALRRAPLHIRAEDVRAAWSPDGRALLVIQNGIALLGQGPVDVLRGTRVSSFGRTDGAASQVGWTPDGRSVSWVGGSSLHILDARTGGRVAEVPMRSAASGWTPAGLIAGDDGTGHAVVYDAEGRRVARFAGTNAAFSFDGTLLASLRDGRVEIRSPRGALLRVVALPHPAGQWLIWTRPRTLYVTTSVAAYDVDSATGRVPRDGGSYPFVVARAGAAAAWTSPAGSRFAVHTVGSDGRVRTLGTVASCTDDGAVVPAVDGLEPTAGGRSVVYASRCYEPLANLYATSPSGGVTRLTTAHTEQTQPRLAPDGHALAYVDAPAVGLSCKGCPSSLWVADARGGHPRRLTSPGDCTFDTDPAWSPDSTQIVYTEGSCSEPSHLMTLPAAGGAPTDLHVRGSSPAWGPARIAYLDPGTDPTSVWTMLPDGSGRTHIGTTAGGCGPAWSAAGKLAFCTRGGTVEIVDGADAQRLTLPFARIASLAWSPDGSRFVLAAQPRGGATLDLFTVASDGTGVRRLTTSLDASSVDWR
jgi:Tol biopolymer transport system component